MNKKEWFDEWFDTPYYHILYKHRDYKEAETFIGNLLNTLKPKQDAKILDLACGKGRHSIYLNKKGYNVTGVDLSAQSINAAKKHENEDLHFAVHDMRDVYKPGEFSHIFNLFTSFGYFEEETENLKAIQAMSDNLTSNGIVVLDFLNPYVIINKLVTDEEKLIDGISFRINKEVKNNWIIKNIRFSDNGSDYHFQEKVKAITRAEFLSYFETAGFEIQSTFGDYDLTPYSASESERLIFIVQKNKC